MTTSYPDERQIQPSCCLFKLGSSCDIMYTGMFKTLKLTESNLAPDVGTELYGFNDSSTKPWGRRQDENNNDPIPGDRLHISLQLHHWEDCTSAAWTCGRAFWRIQLQVPPSWPCWGWQHSEGEKKNKKGGWIVFVFSSFLLLTSQFRSR